MRGAIFDVDGTLLESMEAWFNITVEFFKENNLSFTDEQMQTFKLMTLEESMPLIRNQYKLPMSMEEILLIFKEKADMEYKYNIPAKAGACEYLRKLHNEGVKIAIATSGYESACRSAFLRLGVWDCIDACAFSSEVGVNKSNPDVYLLAAKRLGVEPSDCVVYEDIVPGIMGAKKGGFLTCAVADSSNTAQIDELKAAADMFIEDYRDLL